MKVFAISDLHLGEAVDKPMDVFGGNWVGGYFEKIRADWQAKVTEEDIVLIAGDVSWGMVLSQAQGDLEKVAALKGNKVLIRGNHDYWWNSLKQMNALGLSGVTFLQNNAVKIGSYVFCGTRGWTVPEEGIEQTEEDAKIFKREMIRLEMALKAADKLRTEEGDTVVCMTHYPPFNSKFSDSPFTDLMRKYAIHAGVYGHLHGSSSRYKDIVDKYGIPFYLTSCDFLNNTLLELPL